MVYQEQAEGCTLSFAFSPADAVLGGPSMNLPISWPKLSGTGESALYRACNSNCCSLQSTPVASAPAAVDTPITCKLDIQDTGWDDEDSTCNSEAQL